MSAFEELKEQVYQANLALTAGGLVVGTWGNASGIDADRRHVVIKPSGVPYDTMKAADMVVVSLADGKVAEGSPAPSSDTPTHLALYRAFETVGGVAHTHSLSATAWAQARKAIPAMGTTHADYFRGAVPCTRMLRTEEIHNNYEANTGKVIVECLTGVDPLQCPGVLVAAHGPFAWGRSPAEAASHAAIIEHLAQLACRTLEVEPYPKPVPKELLNKHFLRKHGPDAYYGQPGQRDRGRAD